eukprot:6851820-Prymnesium_polylepis.1
MANTHGTFSPRLLLWPLTHPYGSTSNPKYSPNPPLPVHASSSDLTRALRPSRRCVDTVPWGV